MSVSVRFTLLLKEIKKTANALSKDVGVTPPTIKKIEKGETSPSGTVLTFLIEKYSVDANWLLTGQGSMFVSNGTSNSQKIINGDVSNAQIGDNNNNTTNSNNSNTTEVEYLKSKIDDLNKVIKSQEKLISMFEKNQK